MAATSLAAPSSGVYVVRFEATIEGRNRNAWKRRGSGRSRAMPPYEGDTLHEALKSAARLLGDCCA